MIDRRSLGAWAVTRTQIPWVLVALVPGALTVYFAFNAGGYFAGETAMAATVLLLVLAARIMLATDPLAGVSRRLLVVAAALLLFALWVLVSGSWSDAPGRALIESDRVLLYLAALVLFGSLGGGAARLRWVIGGVGLGAVVVCVAGVTTRVLPDVWPTVAESLARRLEYPVTYSNALGLLAAIGLILCFGMTSSERESRVVRILACGAIPLLGSTLMFTLSRGGMVAALIGLVTFVVVGHTRALITALIAAAPPTIIAVAYTYRSELLAPEQPMTRALRDQGETLAVVVALCMIGAALARALLLHFDAVLSRVHLARHIRLRLMAAGAGAFVVVLAVTAVAIDLPRQYERFVDAEKVTSASPSDPRSRLSNPGSSERNDYWRVATEQFERTPIRGSGAGTYESVWDQHRGSFHLVRDGHSLYLEVLAEFGLVGLALIGFGIIAMLVGIGRRIRGPNRGADAAAFAASLAWAVAAGYDWHWEMAVVTLWFFALGGAALARERSEGMLRIPPLWLRSVLAGACCLLALLGPLRIAVSQDRLEASLNAFLVGRCDVASDAARDSLRALGSRHQPHEVLAYCALVDGDRALAVARMHQAVRRDPANWRLHYGLARMQAMAGRDPRGAAREALRRNPLEPLTRDAAKRFSDKQTPSEWRRAAQGMEIILPDL